MKKSSARIPCAWDRRNSAQPGPSRRGAGSIPSRLRISHTVDGATVMPSPASVTDAPRQRIFYELYRDRAAFDTHEEQPHTKHFLAAREELLEATEVDFLSLADGKTPASLGVANRA